MSLRALANATLLTPEGWRERHAIIVDGPRIDRILPSDQLPTDILSEDLDGNILVPGFIDVQVNGGGGVLFNEEPTVEAIETIAAAHRRFGTTGFLPTLISDDLEIVSKGIAAVDEAIASGVPGVLGIHIEGPFLNRDRKGIHDASKIRLLDDDGLAVVSSLTRGRTLVTLAPECTTGDMIAQLVARGVIVAAGHTDGTYDDIRSALDQGMTGFTHLFNAMSQLGSRDPGAVGAALEDPNAWCGIIVDGRHVSPVSLKLALRCKPADRFMLVTDAMPSVGAADKNFMLQGMPVRVVDGVCVNADGTLAGADLDMAQAVRNAVDLLGVDLATAVGMASSSPAAFLGIGARQGTIAPGKAADLVLLDSAGKALKTWIGGA